MKQKSHQKRTNKIRIIVIKSLKSLTKKTSDRLIPDKKKKHKYCKAGETREHY